MLINYSAETRYPFLKTLLNIIFFGELFTTNALTIVYYPTNIVPKSKLLLWLLLSSIMYLEWSTEVAWISIESLTNIASDLSLIEPLNIPASVGLYFIDINVYCWGYILSSFGSTINKEPC